MAGRQISLGTLVGWARTSPIKTALTAVRPSSMFPFSSIFFNIGTVWLFTAVSKDIVLE